MTSSETLGPVGTDVIDVGFTAEAKFAEANCFLLSTTRAERKNASHQSGFRHAQGAQNFYRAVLSLAR